jgi:hypothetical protein
VDAHRFIQESGGLLGIAAAVAATIVEDAVLTAPPLCADPSVLVKFSGVSGKGPRKLGRTKKVDEWYDGLKRKNVGAPWSDLPRDVYESKRVVFNFYGCLCYAQLMSDRPQGRKICEAMIWRTLDRRGVQKRWGLPDAQTMGASLARYPAVDVDDLAQTIVGAAAVFTCELEDKSDLGAEGDRLLVADEAIKTFLANVTGNLGAIGREVVPASVS